MRVLLATTNPHKVQEIRAVLQNVPVSLIGLTDLPAIREPDETGATFAENARLKACYYSKESRLVAIAEDSGLVVDALGGEPGVRSARFLRPDATYAERFAEIYRRLGQTRSPRTARFVCAVAIALGEGILFETSGTVEGEIAGGPRGERGFGYDPIFYYPPYRQTLAEVDDAAKLAVAHRGVAFRHVREWLLSGGLQHIGM